MNQWISHKIKEIIVYRSLSNDVFINLALEDWLLNNVNHLGRRILLLWRNKPSIVIGRYQNPWMEADYELLRKTNTLLARRRSGGGAVYHDLGNLNVSFFTHRTDYDRTRNLQLVCDAINKQWKGVGLHIGDRHDILCQGKKVSGSAARLGKDHSYHHFTLLINTDREHLHSLLKPNHKLIFSSINATQSVPSPTINISQQLIDNDSCMNYESVCHSISTEFYNVHNIPLKDHQIIDIDPSSSFSLFNGLPKLIKELSSVEWIWNKTPPFTVQINGEKEKLHIKNGHITNTTADSLHLNDYLQSNTTKQTI